MLWMGVKLRLKMRFGLRVRLDRGEEGWRDQGDGQQEAEGELGIQSALAGTSNTKTS